MFMPFSNMGWIIVIKEPKKAMVIPNFSLLVIRSFKKSAPPIAIIKGAVSVIKDISNTVVFSIPKNNKPKATVEVRKPKIIDSTKILFFMMLLYVGIRRKIE